MMAAAVLAATAAVAVGGFTSENIRAYEPLHFDEAALYEEAGPTRYASGSPRDSFQLEIKAFGKAYTLDLRSAAGYFAHDIKLGMPGDNERTLNTAGFYLGSVAGSAASHANVHIDDDGDVRAYFGVGQDTHYISPAHEHFAEEQHFRHIVYREADMAWNGTESQAARKAELATSRAETERSSIRGRRAAIGDTISKGPYDPAFDTCHVAVYIDANFVGAYGGSTGTTIQKEARAASIATQRFLVAATVFGDQLEGTSDRADPVKCKTGSPPAVNAIKIQIARFNFESDFIMNDGNTRGTIGRTLSSITAADASANGTPNDGGKLYLELFSRLDWSKYCLATAFVHTDFDGLLGLAWTAFPDGSGFNGGICTGRYNKNAQVAESLNTAFHSSLNFGTKQPELQSALVLVHELAHNLGSGHDPDTAPTAAQGGAYLMYPYAQDGTAANNQLLSPKSLSEICEVIRDRGACFVESGASSCGNGVVEEDEKCDYGTNRANDECCAESQDTGNGGCQLAAGKACSQWTFPPQNGLCCNNDCSKVTGTDTVCIPEDSCKAAATCGGGTGVCGAAANKAVGTPCDPNVASGCSTSTCAHQCGTGNDAGKCSVEVCSALKTGATPCATGEDACNYKCLDPDSGACIQVGTAAPFNTGGYDSPLTKAVGTACEFTPNEPTSGVCNAQRKCELADGERTAYDELAEIYNQLAQLFSDWLLADSGGIPNYGWLIIGAFLVIGLCVFGCWHANRRREDKIEG